MSKHHRVLGPIVASLLLLWAAPSSSAPTVDTGGSLSLSTAWQPDKCLDSELGEWPSLVRCSNGPHERWKLAATRGAYQLVSEVDGKCIGIFKDKRTGAWRAHLGSCGNATLWKITPSGDHVTLATDSGGATRCLDILNDGQLNNQPILADCKRVSGQLWKLGKLSPGPRTAVAPSVPTPKGRGSDELDGAMPVPASFVTQFFVGFGSADCSFRRRPGKDLLMFRCARSGPKALTCTVGSNEAFRATITTDTGSSLAFATPNNQLTFRANLKSKAASLTVRTAAGASSTCEGMYATEKDLPPPKPAPRSAPDDDDDDDDDDAPSTSPRRNDPAPKGSARGRMCGKNSDCQSGSCKMENRTRGRCQ